MNFIALDFETANEKRHSPCSIGLAIVKEGKLAEKFSTFIRPPEGRFSSMNISIHGITPRHVASSPEFPEIWKSLQPLLEGHTLVAHNASFDQSVLERTLEYYGIRHEPFSFYCTYRISQRLWPELRDHKLSSVARQLGIQFRHHDALEDAQACAEIARQACWKAGVESLATLAEGLGLRNSSARKSSSRFFY